MICDVFENADSRRPAIAAQLDGFAYAERPAIVKFAIACRAGLLAHMA